MASSIPSAPPRRTESHSTGFVLLAIMLVVGMVALSAAYGLTALLPRPRPAPGLSDGAPVVSVTLVGKQLTIPDSWLRDPGANSAGFRARWCSSSVCRSGATARLRRSR